MNWFGKNRFGWKVTALALLIASAPVCTAHAEPDITTGLVGHWKLDETSGTTAVDSSGNGNDGVVTGTDFDTSSITGKLSKAFDSIDINDAITVADDPILTPTSEITVSSWIRSRTFARHRVVSKWSAGNSYMLWVESDSGPRFEVNTVSGGSTANCSTTSIANDNAWHHLVGTYDGATVKIYLDGVLCAQNNRTGNIATDTSDLRLATGTGGLYVGDLDDVRIYNRALMPEDITYLYQSFDGNIKYSEDARVPKYFNGERWVAMGRDKYIPNAVDFDGTNDYLYRTGQSSFGDTKLWSGSFWFRNEVNGIARRLYDTDSGNNTHLYFDASDRFNVQGDTDGSGTNLLIRTSPISDNNWHHIMWSVDMSDPLKRHLFVDGVSDLNVVTYTDDEIQFDIGVGFSLGARSEAGIEKIQGGLSDFWFEVGTYIDFSIEANRRKFIDANGDPVYLGASGSLPTGTAPDIFLSGDTDTWHTNKGTGGGFTENGALTDAITKPTGAYLPTNGLISYWKLDETSGSGVIDYASGNNGTYTNSSGSATTVRNASGVFGGSLSAINHKVALGLTDDLDFSGTNAFTISAWVKPASDDGEHIFQRGSGIVGNGSYLFTRYHLDGTRWRAVIQDGSTFLHTLAPVDSVTPGEWALLTTTWDGTNLVIYENGVQIATNSDVGFTVLADNPTPAYQEVSIGGNGRADDDYFNGSIDDVAVYNRALTPTEISNMYAAGVCANPARINGTIVYNGDGQVMQYCDSLRASGDGWKAMGPAPGDGTGGCSNPTGAEGSLVFNGDYGVMQYCEGDEWISMGKDCPRIGDVCRDGSVYAGLSTDGDIRMFTTPANAGSAMPWNNGNNSGYLTTNQTDRDTGEANTNAIVTYDADTGDGGVQPNQAAQHCYDLEAHGKDDWYLPARYELAVLYDNRELIGGFSGGIYWASTDTPGGTFAWTHRFPDGNLNDIQKENNYIVRCVRK